MAIEGLQSLSFSRIWSRRGRYSWASVFLYSFRFMRNPRWTWSRRGRLSAVPQAAPRWVCGSSVLWFAGKCFCLPWEGISHWVTMSIGLSLLKYLFKISLIIDIMIFIFTTVRSHFIVWNTSLSSWNKAVLTSLWVTSSGSKPDASSPPFPLGGHSERGRWCVLYSSQLHTYWAFFLMRCLKIVGWILDPFWGTEYPYNCSQTIVLGHRSFKRIGYLGMHDWICGSLVTPFKWKVRTLDEILLPGCLI